MNEIYGKLPLLAEEQRALGYELSTTAPANYASINSALTRTLGDTLTLAESLRGNFDGRNVNEGQQGTLVDSIVDSALDVVSKTQNAYSDVTKIQEKSVKLRDQKIGPLIRDIDDLVKSTKENITANQRTTEDKNSTVASLRAQHAQLQSKLSTLKNQKESAEQAESARKLQRGIVMPMWGDLSIADPNGGPSAVMSLQAEIGETQRSMDNLMNDISRSQGQSYQNLATQNESQYEQYQLETLSNQLVEQRSNIQRDIDSINAKQQSLLKLMETSRTLYERVVRLGNASSLVGRSSLTKEGFVTAILDICTLACVDDLTASRVERIRDEIVDGYSGQSVPSQIPGRLAELEGKIEEMKRHMLGV